MRALLTSTRGTGHAAPLLPFAHALRAAGHDVLLAAPRELEALAEREGLPFCVLAGADPERLARARRAIDRAEGFERFELSATELFVGAHARAAAADVLDLVEAWQPDVILRETAEFASLLAAETFRVPTVRVGIALTTTSEDWFASMAADALDALRAEVGVAPDPRAHRARRTPVFTQAPASLDAGQGEVPRDVRRFRAADPAAGAAPEPLPAAWWAEPDAPLVPVSFGTVVPTDGHFPGLYRDAVEALAGLPVRVLVTTGHAADPARLGPLPANVHAERWVPIARVMPEAAALVCHGGAGTTLAALVAGVPLAVLPLFADQPLNARLVSELGAGIALPGGPADAARLGDAVTRLLEDGAHRAAAARIAAGARDLPPVADAVADLEALAAAGQSASMLDMARIPASIPCQASPA